MKKMNFKNILFSAALAAGAMSLASCSLEEENPGGFTMENMAANSVESYQTLLNQCSLVVLPWRTWQRTRLSHTRLCLISAPWWFYHGEHGSELG